MRLGLAKMMLVLSLIGASPAIAQQSAPAQPPLALGNVVSPVLVIDQDRMYRGSAFGQRVTRENQARLEALAADNRQVEASLALEEEELARQRPDMEPEAFRTLADAFDDKVQRTKREQLAKERALQDILAQEQEAFLRAAVPLLERLMLEAGAVVVLDRRFVLLSITQIDITDRAIALLDETIGQGGAAE